MEWKGWIYTGSMGLETTCTRHKLC